MDFHHAQQHYLSVPALQWAKEPGVQPPQESQTGDEVREAPPEPWDYPQFWTPDSHYFLPVNAINLWQQLFTLNLTTQLGMAHRPKTPAYRKWKQKNNEFNINVGWIAKNQLICKYTKKIPIQIMQWLLSPLAPLLAEWMEGTKGGKRDQ